MYLLAGLTEKQRAILDFIKAEIDERGYPPTHRDICAAFGWRSIRASAKHLLALERKGYIERDEYVVRGIRVTEPREDHGTEEHDGRDSAL